MYIVSLPKLKYFYCNTFLKVLSMVTNTLYNTTRGGGTGPAGLVWPDYFSKKVHNIFQLTKCQMHG